MIHDRVTDVGTGVDTSVRRISTVYNISNILAIRVESAIVDRIPKGVGRFFCPTSIHGRQKNDSQANWIQY